MKQKILRKGTLSDEELETRLQNYFDEGWTFVGSITPSITTGISYRTEVGEIFVILQRNNL